jgi:hypothetical protein
VAAAGEERRVSRGALAAGGGAADAAISKRRLVAMAVVAGILGMLALRVVPQRLAPPELRPAAPLLAADPAAVREVELWRGEQVARLRRVDGGSWTLALAGGPEQTVDGESVRSFLDLLHSTAPLTQFVESDLAAFGLQPPRATLALRDGGETRLAFGDRNPPLTALYVQVLPAPDIAVVGSVVQWELDKLVAFVDREAGQAAHETGSPVRR